MVSGSGEVLSCAYGRCWSSNVGPTDAEESFGNYVGSLLSNGDFWSGLLETVGGSLWGGAGLAVTASGVVECGTGVLCPVGAGQVVVGGTMTVSGAAMATSGSDKLGKAFREADSSSSRSLEKDEAGDLGANWRPNDPSRITGSNGCEECAVEIQSKIGGDRMRITDSLGAPVLGKYRGRDTNWAHHDVVLREGRVYDAWTGRQGEPLEEYMSRWQYREYLKMSPSPYKP
ncbi:hypothetical protein [Streptomyces sp. NPDC002324]